MCVCVRERERERERERPFETYVNPFFFTLYEREHVENSNLKNIINYKEKLPYLKNNWQS